MSCFVPSLDFFQLNQIKNCNDSHYFVIVKSFLRTFVFYFSLIAFHLSKHAHLEWLTNRGFVEITKSKTKL